MIFILKGKNFLMKPYQHLQAIWRQMIERTFFKNIFYHCENHVSFQNSRKHKNGTLYNIAKTKSFR